MSIPDEVGRKIVSLRKQRKMSQEYLALYSDISVTYLRDIEHGTANPSLLVLSKLAQTLNVPVSELLAENLPQSCTI